MRVFGFNVTTGLNGSAIVVNAAIAAALLSWAARLKQAPAHEQTSLEQVSWLPQGICVARECRSRLRALVGWRGLALPVSMVGAQARVVIAVR
jgi:hypothetical protein